MISADTPFPVKYRIMDAKVIHNHMGGVSIVRSLSFLAILVTLLLSLGLPIAILAILVKGRKGAFGAYAAGALGFIVPQLMVRIPILQALQLFPFFTRFTTGMPVLYSLFLAMSAGLFETSGRLIVLRAALFRKLSFMTGLSAGAGHGGIESAILVGLTYVNNLIYSILINTGHLSSLMQGNPEAAEQIRQVLTGTSPALFLAAGFERVFTMAFHIALSILMAYLILRKHSAIGFFLVAFLHFTVDFSVLFMQMAHFTVWAIEGSLFCIALLSLVFLFKIRPLFGADQAIPADPGEQAVQEGY